MKRLFSLLFLVLAATPISAHALTVKNLSDVPQQLLVHTPGKIEKVIIQPGVIYYIGGVGVLLQQPNQGITSTKPLEEYVIWKNGKLTRQRSDDRSTPQ